MELIELFAFLLSIYGYILLGNKKWKVDIEFLPVIIFSSIGCIVFLSGILNIMNIVFGAIFLFGLVLVMYYLMKHDAKINVPFGILFCIVVLVYLLFFLKDVKYYHNDIFAHWGLSVKNMFINSRFPNFQDEIIEFQSYPLGSACFIWYVCKIIGYSEGHALFAQTMLILSCACTLFVISKKATGIRKIVVSVLIAFECIIWITFGANVWNGLFHLLVDILLATVAIAAFGIVYYYREDVSKACVCVLPLIIFEVCIKNSGIMWVFAILAEILYFSCAQKVNKKQIVSIVAVIIGIPAIFRILWDAHVDMVFVNGSESNHAMTLDNCAKIFNGKTEEDIEKVTQLFLQRVFTIDNVILIQIILLLVFAVILCVINKKIVNKSYLMFGTFFLMGVYVVYQIGNYFTYLMSMETIEAVKLAGYDRYVSTLGFFVFGVISIYFFVILNLLEAENKFFKRYGTIIMLLMILVVFTGKSMYVKSMFTYEEPRYGMLWARYALDDIVDGYHLETGKSSIVYIGGDNEDSDLRYYNLVAKYILYSSNITIIDSRNIDKLNEIDNYDYAIILRHDEVVDSWLADSALPFENDECLKQKN